MSENLREMQAKVAVEFFGSQNKQWDINDPPFYNTQLLALFQSYPSSLSTKILRRAMICS
jgi:hypothetical protein